MTRASDGSGGGGYGTRLRANLADLAGLVDDLEPDRYSGPDAGRLTELFAWGERLCAAGKALAAKRVAETGAWKPSGERSAAAWLGRLSGQTATQAAGTIQSAKRVRSQPDVEAAVRAGRLSEAQHSAVSAAADEAPERTGELLDTARHDSLGALRERSRRIKLAAGGQAERDRYRRIHARRHLRFWTDDEGASRVSGLLTPDASAIVQAALIPFQNEVFDAARCVGSTERRDCHAADALVAMARAAGRAPTPDPSDSDNCESSRPSRQTSRITTNTSGGGEEPATTSPDDLRPGDRDPTPPVEPTSPTMPGSNEPASPNGASTDGNKPASTNGRSTDSNEPSGPDRASIGSNKPAGPNGPRTDSNEPSGPGGSEDGAGPPGPSRSGHGGKGEPGHGRHTPDAAVTTTKRPPGGRHRPAQINVIVDHAALIRGWAHSDETCEIDGTGPVPVATVRAMTPDAFLTALTRDGVDIRTVVHLGRTVTALQHTALIARDRECVVPGCHVRTGLEIDHVAEWTATKITTIDALARLCHYHHGLKTYRDWHLEGPPGHWTWHPPGGARPDPPQPAPGPIRRRDDAVEDRHDTSRSNSGTPPRPGPHRSEHDRPTPKAPPATGSLFDPSNQSP